MRADSTRLLGLAAALLMPACATTSATKVPEQVPVTRYEMEPLKIEAVKSPDGGFHLESFDASELFEQAGAALSDKRYDDAIRAYDRLLAEFPDTRYTRAALYNVGLAYQGKKEWATAIARFQVLAQRFEGTSDAKDALFQIGASYAELGNWPTSAEFFARLLERKDLAADDKIEALARRGFAQFQLKDLDTAERTFKSALLYFHQIESQERLQTDFYLGLCRYHLGQIPHERFRAVPLRLPERQMEVDLEEKARLLLFAQRQYIDTIKLGNPQWASASGFQIGSLYEELYDAFMHAPVPPDLLTTANSEKREIYYEELRKKIRILLEKSVRVHEQNLLMMERLGVQNEWRDKSKLAYGKLQKLLDPSYKLEFADPNTPVSTPSGAPVPVVPAGRAPSKTQEPPPAGAPPPAPVEEREGQEREPIHQRQIL